MSCYSDSGQFCEKCDLDFYSGYCIMCYEELEHQLTKAQEALKKYGIHENLCRYGLLPQGIHRQSFSAKEDGRMERAAIKECSCGLLAAYVDAEAAKGK